MQDLYLKLCFSPLWVSYSLRYTNYCDDTDSFHSVLTWITENPVHAP